MKKHRVIISISVLVIFLSVLTAFAVFAEDKGQPQTAPQTTPQVTPLFTVARFVVGTDIVDRQPVGVAKSFPASTEKVFCYLEATGIPKDTKISFVWIYKQKEMLKTTMTLKSGDKWRTYSNKNLRGLKGDWEVQLISSTGAVIKDVKFKVE
jgi:Protein of unknown function (DUF2914)